MLRFELLQSLLQGDDKPLPKKNSCAAPRGGLDGRFHACAALAAAAKTARRDALAQVCGQFCRNKPAFCLPYDEHSCFLLLDLSAISSESAQLDWVRAFAEGLYGCIDEYLNVRPRLGVSAVQAGADRLHAAVRQARTAMQHTLL